MAYDEGANARGFVRTAWGRKWLVLGTVAVRPGLLAVNTAGGAAGLMIGLALAAFAPSRQRRA
jgi:hypothetical protein